jgi:hypothetical protein
MASAVVGGILHQTRGAGCLHLALLRRSEVSFARLLPSRPPYEAASRSCEEESHRFGMRRRAAATGSHFTLSVGHLRALPSCRRAPYPCGRA